ncbi:MAG TPA: hypothetical protein VFV38_33835 [Ktedonobacteraceae bacterium]|nr:hypothetical protein [Ktedonobacteraceae bacterium]
MPKDPKKYHYITIGLLRDSWALEQLLADAEIHHMLDQLGKLAALRLTEYYELVDKGAVLVGSVPANAQPRTSQRGTTGSGQGREQARSTREDQSSDEAIAPVTEHADVNADNALSFFLDEEEQEE